MKKFMGSILVTALSLCLLGTYNLTFAGDQGISIATVKIQYVLNKAKAGLEAQRILQAKAADLQKDIQQEQEALMTLQNQIEMKSSVWSQEVRDEKERDYQRKLRSLQMQSEDAKYEFRQVEKKVMAPIFKALNEVIVEIGKEKGFTLILANEGEGLTSRTGLIYVDDALDVSDLVVKEWDAKMPK
jgi:outer membrane protein